MKRLYLDVCTLCRPFDDQAAMRIRLETDAFHLIIQYVQNGVYTMVVSPVHIREIEATADKRERSQIIALLDKYGTNITCDLQRARERAEELHSLKFGIADAAHLAFAEAGADFFISCDDKLLKKCRRVNLSVVTINVVEFCVKEDLR